MNASHSRFFGKPQNDGAGAFLVNAGYRPSKSTRDEYKSGGTCAGGEFPLPFLFDRVILSVSEESLPLAAILFGEHVGSKPTSYVLCYEIISPLLRNRAGE